MTLWLAIAGWVLVTGLALQAARLTRRLELVARAEHELRGPVTALTLAVEALARRPELSRRAAALDAHLDRLRLGLADLGAARLGRRAAPTPAEIPVELVARAVADAWEPAARGAGAEISFEWRAGPVVACGDRARLSQALGNVLSNAVEHGGERIEVRGERDGESVRIAVGDDGPTGSASERRAARAASAPGHPVPEVIPSGPRGRGLRIALHALGDMRASLRAPARFLGSGRGRSRPAASSEVLIELPAIEHAAPPTSGDLAGRPAV